MNSVDVSVQKSETEQNQAPTGIHVIWRRLANKYIGSIFTDLIYRCSVIYLYLFFLA